MAGKSIKNDIVTRFKTEGAKKAQKDTESVGRSQTRLGQASASTGRQFSAQASGLGGLVAAYAGAAANVFAITQAFAALQRAAQADTIIRGTKTLALEIGQSGGRILASVQKITQGQLTLAEAAQNVNIALSAGFNTEQIEGLTEISLKASRALGRSLTDAFTRVTRGAAKLEPELLDELGIFTRIDPAVEAYASKMNVAASSLTNFEKRQAFVNAVIEEGNKKFSSIDTSVDSPQKSIEQLIATLTDLATEFGQLLAQVLKPIADFFRNNIGNALLLFGGILALVFGKAAQLIGAFVSQNVTNLGRFANALAATGASGKKTREELSKLGTALQVLKKSDVGGAAGTLGRFTTGDAGLNQQLSEIRQRAMAPGGEQDAGRRAKDLEVLKTARDKLNAANIKGGKQNEFIAKTTRAYTAAVSNLNIAQRVAVGSANLLSVAVTGIGKAFAFAMPFVQGFFAIFGIAQLVASAFDFDILGSIKDFFVDSSQAAENFQKGLVGAFSAVAGSAKKLEDQLFGLGASQKQIDELPETLADIADRFKEVQVVRMTRPGERPNFSFGGAAGNPDTQGIPGIVGNQNEVFIETITDPTIEQRINAVNEAIQGLGNTVEDRLERKLLELYSKSLKELGTNQELIGALSRKLGIGADKVAESFKEVVKLNETGTATFKMLGMTIDNTKDNFADLTENQQKNVENIFLLNNTLKTASDSFNRGAATSETLSKKLIGATKTLSELRQQIQLLPGEVVTREMLDELEEATQRVKDLEKQVRQLKGLEAIGKSIDTVFGNAIKTFDQALAKGLISGGGLASKDANQVAQTQLNFLVKQTEFATARTEAEKEQLKVLEEALKKRAAGAERNAAEVKALENRDKALKVAAGRALEFFQNTEKARKAEQKRLDILKAQNGILEQQLELAEKQNKLKEDKATQAAEMQVLKDRQSMFKTELNVIKEIAKLAEKRVKLEEKLTAQRAKNLALQNKAAFIRGRAGGRSTLQGIEDDISGARGRLDTMNRFGNLSSTAQVDAVRKELIDLEFDRQQEVIKQKKAAAQEEYRIQTQLLDDKKGVLEREVTNNRLAEAARQAAVKKEESIAALNNIMARDKIQNDINNLASQTAIAKQQRDISKAQIEADRAKIAADNLKRDADLTTLELEQEFTKQMLNANKGLVDNVAQLIATATGKDVSDVRKNLQLDEKFNVATADLNQVKILNLLAKGQQQEGLRIRGQTADEKFTGVRDANQIRKTQLENELSALRKRQRIEGELREEKEKALRQEFSDNQDLLQLKLKGLQDEKDRNLALFEEKKAGLERELELIDQSKQKRLKALSEEQDVMKNLANDISGVLQNEIGGSVKSLFQAIREGTLTTENFKEGFRDMLANIAGGIADSVLQRTLIDPMNDFISETVGGLFGVEKKGADALTYTGDSANVNVTNMGAGKSIADSVNKDNKSIFDTISEKVGDVKDKFVGFLTGLGEKGKEIFTGLGEIFTGVFKSFSGAFSGGGGGNPLSGIMSMFTGGSSPVGPNTAAMFGDMGSLQGIGGFAAGGRVRNFAAGGMNRDRVPALLEPGEFVMKRSAARSIGEGNLSAMNSTGQMGGNVSVNIVNQGTPQEATEQSQPKFDGEKFVIDIVTRDLRNNGPIRKSMRGAS